MGQVRLGSPSANDDSQGGCAASKFLTFRLDALVDARHALHHLGSVDGRTPILLDIEQLMTSDDMALVETTVHRIPHQWEPAPLLASEPAARFFTSVALPSHCSQGA